MDFNNACRCCLVKGNKMRSIQATVHIEKTLTNISNIVESCLNIKLSQDENYPQNICYSCISQLQTAYSLKAKIEKNNKIIAKQIEEMNNECNITENEVMEDNFQDDVDEEPPSPELTECTKEEEKYYCLVCNLYFSNTQQIYQHCRENHRPINAKGKYECKYCLEHFKNVTLVTKHRRRHLTPQFCPWCWDEITEYDSHILACSKYSEYSTERIKIKNSETSPCYHCGKSYPRDYLRIHLLTHGPDIVKCPICNKGFKVKGNLSTHMKLSHSQEKPHKCPYCQKCFKLSGCRKRHIRQEHIKERNQKCEECGKAFFMKSNLRHHMFVHTGEKIYKCRFCDKAYQNRWGLKVHNKTQHPEENNYA